MQSSLGQRFLNVAVPVAIGAVVFLALWILWHSAEWLKRDRFDPAVICSRCKCVVTRVDPTLNCRGCGRSLHPNGLLRVTRTVRYSGFPWPLTGWECWDEFRDPEDGKLIP